MLILYKMVLLLALQIILIEELALRREPRRLCLSMFLSGTETTLHGFIHVVEHVSNPLLALVLLDDVNDPLGNRAHLIVSL